MLDKIKNFILKAVDVLAKLVLLLFAMIFILSQGIVVTVVVNALRMDTYLPPLVGIEMVFLLFSLLWVPLWCLVVYSKKR